MMQPDAGKTTPSSTIRLAAAGVGTFLDVLMTLGEGEEGFYGEGRRQNHVIGASSASSWCTFDLQLQ